MITRPAIFKWRQTEPGIILCAVQWHLRYSLSLRDVDELLEKRGLSARFLPKILEEQEGLDELFRLDERFVNDNVKRLYT